MKRRSGPALALLLTLALGAACSRSAADQERVPISSLPRTTEEAAPTSTPLPVRLSGKRWSYTALDFKDDQQGWAAGLDESYAAGAPTADAAAIFRTTDGGQSWNQASVPPFVPAQVHFWDEKTGVALGTSATCLQKGGPCQLVLAATADSGKSWTTAFKADLTDFAAGNEASLSFQDSSQGYALYVTPARSYLLLTADGAKSWWQPSPLPDGYQAEAVAFVGAKHGWVSGRQCTGAAPAEDCKYAVFATADGGEHWQRQFDLPGGRRLHAGSIDFVDENKGWLFPTADTAYCSMGGCEGPLYGTQDGGKTWVDLKWKEQIHTDQGMTGFPERVDFVGPTRGWMLVSGGASSGVGGIAVTADGGLTWDRYGPHLIRNFSLLQAVTDQVAWAVGNGGDGLPMLMKTVDGAKTWTPVKPPFPVDDTDKQPSK